jgi:hypothetical protein
MTTHPLFVEVDEIANPPARPADPLQFDPVQTTKTSDGAINMLAWLSG